MDKDEDVRRLAEWILDYENITDFSSEYGHECRDCGCSPDNHNHDCITKVAQDLLTRVDS